MQDHTFGAKLDADRMRLLVAGLLGVLLVLSSDALMAAAWRGRAHIDLTEATALVDESVGIHVGGLPPNQRFTVR